MDEIEQGIAHEKARRANARPVHEYVVPESVAEEIGVSYIGLVVLTGNEYEMALGRARTNPMRLALELPKTALYSIDGQRVSLADGSADRAWEKLGGKGRDLVVAAYGKLHNPEQGEVDAFLQSRKVTVG